MLLKKRILPSVLLVVILCMIWGIPVYGDSIDVIHSANIDVPGNLSKTNYQDYLA